MFWLDALVLLSRNIGKVSFLPNEVVKQENHLIISHFKKSLRESIHVVMHVHGIKMRDELTDYQTRVLSHMHTHIHDQLGFLSHVIHAHNQPKINGHAYIISLPQPLRVSHDLTALTWFYYMYNWLSSIMHTPFSILNATWGGGRGGGGCSLVCPSPSTFLR